MTNTKKQIPEFRSEEEERTFWAKHDSTEFIDWQAAQRRRFPNLKPTLRSIPLRLPVSMIEDPKRDHARPSKREPWKFFPHLTLGAWVTLTFLTCARSN